MRVIDLILTDTSRDRKIPVCVYLPDNMASSVPVVIWGPGYQVQEDLKKPDIKLACKKYDYLAEFFTNKGYGFISIQHEILGDNDGLETIDPNMKVQYEVRKHLYVRGERNINFVIGELQKRFSELKWDKFIIGGHSNGGDIAKFFANNNPELISCVLALDARRCIIEAGKDLRVLMFEANDTETDQGVIPGAGKRKRLDLVLVKPKDAVHASYRDDLSTEEIKRYVLSAIEWFIKRLASLN